MMSERSPRRRATFRFEWSDARPQQLFVFKIIIRLQDRSEEFSTRSDFKKRCSARARPRAGHPQLAPPPSAEDRRRGGHPPGEELPRQGKEGRRRRGKVL